VSISEFHNRHRAEWDREADDPTRAELIQSWLRTDTVDYWRHARGYEAAGAFVHRPELEWLTVGDGRFGLDSIRLRRLGVQSILPTDIGDALLKRAKALGLISDFAAENAEALSFADESFDIVFCKESYHHFPRAPLALYEMLRVAREAVILSEPRDFVIDSGTSRTIGPIGLVRGFIRWLHDRLKIRGRVVPIADRYVFGDSPTYEESGNYIYAISSRELEKVALALNMPSIALKGLNDQYVPGGETELAAGDSQMFRDLRDHIDKADRRTAEGRGSTTLLMAILFKREPDQVARTYLTERDWVVVDLPRNPYVGLEATL
jgi:ubiquinone/menaquinone biosynthesis C-methylase UbiE